MKVSVKVPSDVQVDVEGGAISVKGSKGSNRREFLEHPLFTKSVKIEKNGDTVTVSSTSDKKKIKAMVGTVAAHLKNMIKGVSMGYTAKMKIIFVHFPMTVKVAGEELIITNFLGERYNRKAPIPQGAKVEIKGDEIIITGIDKDIVGTAAKNIEESTRIKARDRRVFGDGIFIAEKPR